jgi:hypothetical protein
VLKYHLTQTNSPLKFVTTEMIDLFDYGENAKYSLFENNVACARWIREEWVRLKGLQRLGLLNPG